MNDRFKFRCYNKFQEKMFDVNNISYINGIVKRIEVQDDDRILIFDEWQNNIDNTVLMQCTGLKDSSRRLIYEGDIVIYTTLYSGNLTGVVYWDSEILQYKLKLLYSSGEIYADRDLAHFVNKNNIEVIGNIYENKELLEEECQK